MVRPLWRKFDNNHRPMLPLKSDFRAGKPQYFDCTLNQCDNIIVPHRPPEVGLGPHSLYS